MTGAAPLENERDAFARRDVVDEKETQLGPDRVELDPIDRVGDQRGDRHDGFRVPGFPEQPQGVGPDSRIRVPQVANDVIETDRLCPGRQGCGEGEYHRAEDVVRHVHFYRPRGRMS